VGQLIYVATVLSLIWLLRHAASQLLEMALVKLAFDRLDVTIAYGIGSTATYWLSLTVTRRRPEASMLPPARFYTIKTQRRPWHSRFRGETVSRVRWCDILFGSKRGATLPLGNEVTRVIE
jgi:hypothetical protein